MYSDKEIKYNELILTWNKKLNLVSRKKKNVFDLIDDSKLFFKAIDFKKNSNTLDLGTGGGFPGIVLALQKPEANFVLIDSIGKKIKALKHIIDELNLSNVTLIKGRAEDLINEKKYINHFDYVVARSVSSLSNLINWSKKLLKRNGKLITIKGGDIKDEIGKARKNISVKNITIEEINERKIITVELIYRLEKS